MLCRNVLGSQLIELSHWGQCHHSSVLTMGAVGHLQTRGRGLGLEAKLRSLLGAEAVKQRRDVHRGEGGDILGERGGGQGQAEQQTLLRTQSIMSEL